MGYINLAVIFIIVVLVPLTLTIFNLIHLVRPAKKFLPRRILTELGTIFGGGMLTCLLLSFADVTSADWTTVLANRQTHSPIAPEQMPTSIAILVFAVSGYFVLRFVRLEKMPPLLAATAIGAMYMGVIWWGVFVYQLSLSSIVIPIAFYFFNLCLIVAAVVRDVVKAWQTIDEKKMPEQKLGGRRPWTNRLRHFLYSSHNWPWLGAVAILPLSGLLLILLLLFGQGPDAAVKMFTDTADWRLSQRIPPPNVYFDEHYLCTVAAGGHPFLVKPIRYGERHGHRVIVNRQLATANAFEDLLAERLPRFHRRIRAFYDAWGYPIARHIRRPWLADLVYLVMKPAEWLFILILYCFDVDPETRIAMQYLPQRKRINFDETISESHSNL
ncbi:MAG: DUF6688 domain-containing protein [Fastidiosipilaceae bacterium]